MLIASVGLNIWVCKGYANVFDALTVGFLLYCHDTRQMSSYAKNP